MSLGLKSPCERCPNVNCRKYKECRAWALWFSNEWYRVRMMFMEEEDDIRRNGTKASVAI